MHSLRKLISNHRRRSSVSAADKNRQRRLFVEQLEDRRMLAVFNVTMTGDAVDGGDGFLSLREAVIAANANAGSDQINLPAGTYTLTIDGTGEDLSATGDLDVTDALGSLTIIGAGTASSAIDASGLTTPDRVIDVLSGASVSLDGVTITGGDAGSDDGGGLRNRGTTDLTRSAVTGNSARNGGGIDTVNAVLSLYRTDVSNNDATELGGGIHTAGSGLPVPIITIDASTIANNIAVFSGGGIIHLEGDMTVSNSTVSGNVSGSSGGGIINDDSMIVSNSTISGNSANGGGGIFHVQGQFGIEHSTVTNNTAISVGGGMLNFTGSSFVTMTSTIMAGNTAPSSNDLDGPITSGGNNLLGDDSGSSGLVDGVNGDQVGTGASPIDALLGPLQNNGGPTETHALTAGSPAIDAGSNGAGLTQDQRRYFRVIGAGIDVGAVERNSCGTIVLNTNDSGLDSLREAITCSNSQPGFDTVSFEIGSGTQTIQPLTALPTITASAILDATTQPGFAGTPIIELDGSLAGTSANGLRVTAGGSTVRGFVINRFQGPSPLLGGSGIFVDGGSSNSIEGNFIGTNVSGTAALPNETSGIYLFGSTDNIIGGTTAAARNLISGNAREGVEIALGFSQAGLDGRNVIIGNYFGTDITGTFAIPNARANVAPQTNNNIIGGTTAAERNLLSGSRQGVRITRDGNVVQGNYIGTNAAGTSAIRNEVGVAVVQGEGNTIGGTTPGAGNVLSGNLVQGIQLDRADNNTIEGNLIGTDPSGTFGVPNGRGVFVGGTSTGDVIRDNLIAFNSGDGVELISNGVGTPTGITIQQNSIRSNGTLGIDLNQDGVTLNDPGDGDAGSNELQNFPVIASAETFGASTQISGTLNSAPSTSFTLEFFSNPGADASGFGEGQTFLIATNVSTDPSGNASFSTNVPALVTGDVVTGTATNPGGSTSEFSAATAVAAGQLIVNDTGDVDDGDIFNGVTTLREAINFANSNSGADAILFDASLTGQTITLAGTQLPAIDDDLTITGLGSSNLTVNAGGGPNRIFSIRPETTVEISDVTLVGGTASFGAAINSRGNLTIRDSVIRDGVTTAGSAGIDTSDSLGAGLTIIDSDFLNNSAGGASGGAVIARVPLFVSGSTFDGNSASGNSGAIALSHSNSAYDTEIVDSVFSNNTAGAQGGAIDAYIGFSPPYFDVTISGSTFTGNSAGSGGALRIRANASITNSTFTGNTATGTGGALLIDSAVPITGSTFVGNSASFGGAITGSGPSDITISNSTISGNASTGAGAGGGGLVLNGNATIQNSTIVNNTTISGSGGGIFDGIAGNTITVGNSIIALNTRAGTSSDVAGTFSSLGYNLIGNTQNSTGFNATGDQTGTLASPLDPVIDTLQNNGGTTLTHKLLAGSTAVDAGDPASTLTTDQRGVARPIDGTGNGSAIIDIGAFEREQNLPPSADNNSFLINENSPTTTFVGSVTANDPNSDDVLTYSITAGNTGSAFTIDSLGNITVDNSLALDFESTPVFNLTVQVTDAFGLTDTAAISINLNDVNEAPVAAPDADSVTEDAVPNTATGNVLTNDDDIDGDTLSVSQVNGNAANVGTTIGTTYGTVQIDSNGAYTYTLDNSNPTVDALDDSDTLIDVVNYTASDGSLASISTLTITINGVSDETIPEEIDDLVDEVQDLLDAGVLNNGQANPMLNFLDQAIKEFNKGKKDKAIKKLEDFVGRVEDLLDQGTLTPAEGQPLIDAANDIIADILATCALTSGTRAGAAAPNPISSGQLQSVIDAAIDYWDAAGEHTQRLSNVSFEVRHLPHSYLGFASSDVVWIDRDAAGHGWSLESTPADGRMHLLSAVTHELGHVLGLHHDDYGVMSPTLMPGLRLLPQTAATSSVDLSSAFVMIPNLVQGFYDAPNLLRFDGRAPTVHDRSLIGVLAEENLVSLDSGRKSAMSSSLLLTSKVKRAETHDELFANFDELNDLLRAIDPGLNE